MRSRTDLRLWGAVALALAVALGGLVRPLQARHDPLRVIFTQAKEKPNIYILLDESGSLWWWPDDASSCRTVQYGNRSLCTGADFTAGTNPYTGQANNCRGHGYWALAYQDSSYSYWYFVPPSRAVIIKNFFGNCVYLWEVRKDWLASLPNCPASPVCTGIDSRGVRYFRFPRNGGPTGGAYLDMTAGGSGTWRNYTCTSSSTAEPHGDPAYTRRRDPYRFVERNKDLAFWGMAKFTTAIGGNASRVTPGLPTDNNSNQSSVTAINNEMGTIQPVGACQGNRGFTPGGGTPTQRALNFSKGELKQWFNQDSAGQFCRRPYYVILLTDGQSNCCNPGGCSAAGEWGNSCTGWNNPAAGNFWTKMPPGRADDLFLSKDPPRDWTNCYMSSQDKPPPIPVQTFAVGVSPDVARCELNLVAYAGRTDSSREDAGVRWQDNTERSPQNTSGLTDLTNYWAPPRPECSACPPDVKPDPNRTTPGCDRRCGNYAFFASDPDELQNAFNKILAGILAGDYSTGTSTSVGGDVTATLGSILVPSTQIPSWRGALRHWESVECGTPPPPGTTFVDVSTIKFNELCDKLKDPTITIISGVPTCGAPSNPKNLPYFRLRWDAACSLLDQADPSRPDYGRNIYTVSSNCGRGDAATGPHSDCRTLQKLEKGNAALRNWLRSNVTTVNWSTVDLNGNGVPASTDNDDIDILIDFILGGTGSSGPGSKRAWLLGDLVGSSPVIVARPETYISGTVPPKTAFDLLVKNRPPLAYVTANDGLLHAFELKHNPKDATSPPIERFAFLPPQAFPAVIQLLQNYRSYVARGVNIPTGQAEPPNFDDHIWTMAAPLNTADVWVRWWPASDKWRTVLLVPMGPKIPGLYALDVSLPTTSPPFSVLWYWNGAEARAQACLTCDKVWSGVPIAPSFHGGKAIGGQFYENWMVGVGTTSSEDTHSKSYFAFLAVDTGQTAPFNYSRVWPSSLPNCDPKGNTFCIPFHVYGNPAMQSADVDVNRSDTLATHLWFADTLGRVPMHWLADPNASVWRPNSPSPIVDMGSTQPIYFTPALAHALGRKAMLMATATGSILETDGDVNDKNGTFCQAGKFCTFIGLDLFQVTATKDLQPDPSLPANRRQFRLQMANVTVPVLVDSDGDGVPDTTVNRNLSPHTRVTARPLITVQSFRKMGGSKATVYFLLYDPMVFNAAAQACTGESFLFPIEVEFSDISGAVGFATPSSSWTWGSQLKPLQSLGLVPVMGITAVAGKIVVVKTGYGEAVATPYLPGHEAIGGNPTLPQLRGVKRIQ